jgi:DNA-directed RNA polymerase specialized sigma24 family protein
MWQMMILNVRHPSEIQDRLPAWMMNVVAVLDLAIPRLAAGLPYTELRMVTASVLQDGSYAEAADACGSENTSHSRIENGR